MVESNQNPKEPQNRSIIDDTASQQSSQYPSEYSDESYGDIVFEGDGANWYFGSMPRSEESKREELRAAYAEAFEHDRKHDRQASLSARVDNEQNSF